MPGVVLKDPPIHFSNPAKKKYCDKLYNAAELIECACGCGTRLKNRDRAGRPRSYVSGHNNRKYANPKEYRKAWARRNRPTLYQAKLERGRALKVKLILYKGGHCTACDLAYNGTNGCLFDFHHRDPSTKDIQICQRTLTTYAYERLRQEADKCDLICSNCHRLHHGEPF